MFPGGPEEFVDAGAAVTKTLTTTPVQCPNQGNIVRLEKAADGKSIAVKCRSFVKQYFASSRPASNLLFGKDCQWLAFTADSGTIFNAQCPSGKFATGIQLSNGGASMEVNCCATQFQ